MKRITGDINNKDFKRLYLLYGPEKYLCLKARDLLLDSLDIRNDIMNFTSVSQKSLSDDKIIDLCETIPFFSDRRVILLEDTGYFNEKNDRLASYINDLPSYLTLIFTEDKVDKRGKLYKAASRYERVIEFKPLTEDDLSKWVINHLKENDMAIQKNALDYFLSGVGTDLNYISNELEKLIAYCSENKVITTNEISEISSFRTENRIFEMISDITENKKTQALDKYYDLLALKEPPMRILYLISRQYLLLYNIKSLLSSVSDERRIAEILKIHPYAVKKSIPVCRKYKESDLKSILNECASLEEDVKRGTLNDRLSVELMILNRK